MTEKSFIAKGFPVLISGKSRSAVITTPQSPETKRQPNDRAGSSRERGTIATPGEGQRAMEEEYGKRNNMRLKSRSPFSRPYI